MDYFFDGQLRRYITQFIRVMSNFGYKNSKGQIVRVPAIYGDMSRQVAQILRKNSENAIPSAPFIACYIKDIQYDISRVQDPTFVSKVNIREREWDPDTRQYLYSQGSNYTVERIMPSPFTVTFAADIWASNTDQKMQIWEQLVVLFNPSLEIQTTDNYVDWTSLSVLTLQNNMIWSSRSIPQGVDQNIDVCTLTFSAPIWITPPAKVKKLGIITKIIADVFALSQGEIAADYSNPNAVIDFGSPDDRTVVTPGNFELLVLDNVATLIKSSADLYNVEDTHPTNTSSWRQLLDHYPGKFRAGLSQLRLKKDNGNEVVAYISLDSTDERRMVLSFDTDTIPSNTVINNRGTIDAIINPETYAPPAEIISGTRFLILENINVNSKFGTAGYDGPDAWKNTDGSDFQAHANDIIEWNGVNWSVIFNSSTTSTTTYITNTYTGIQYKWSNGQWSKSFEGLYDKSLWRLIL
jgi:hypothetical protein